MTRKVPQVLDPCCGSRKFYFDKESPAVIYGDIRDESFFRPDYTRLVVHPDEQMDVTALPFESERFSLVVFDPPHLKYAGPNSFMRQAYGVLPKRWHDFLREGFRECWRVLKPNGTLIFKWSTVDVPINEVLYLFEPIKPLFGNQKPCGKAGSTFWMVFFKEGGHDAD